MATSSPAPPGVAPFRQSVSCTHTLMLFLAAPKQLCRIQQCWPIWPFSQSRRQHCASVYWTSKKLVAAVAWVTQGIQKTDWNVPIGNRDDETPTRHFEFGQYGSFSASSATCKWNIQPGHHRAEEGELAFAAEVDWLEKGQVVDLVTNRTLPHSHKANGKKYWNVTRAD